MSFTALKYLMHIKEFYWVMIGFGNEVHLGLGSVGLHVQTLHVI